MPNPAISPTTVTSSNTFTISNSRGAIVNLSLDLSGPKTFTVQYPTAGNNVQITLIKIEGGVVRQRDLLPGGIHNDSFTNRTVVPSTNMVGADTELSCTLSSSVAVAGDLWVVKIVNNSPPPVSTTYVFTQGQNLFETTITRIMSDPVSAITAPTPGAIVPEKNSVNLTAALANGTAAAPTVIGAPIPTITYTWNRTSGGDAIAVTAFPTIPSASQTFPFNPPGVYGNKTINILVTTRFEAPELLGVGVLENTSVPQALVIVPRTQHLMLVLDRSGSMSGSKWENAQTAARILAQLFAGLRKDVSPTDKVGVLVFEDNTCNWHNPPFNALVTPILPLSSIDLIFGDEFNDICTLDFGPAGSCTPISDGLLKAMELFNGLGVADDPRFTIILLTDGYENSGTTRVDPSTSAPAFVRNFSVARNDYPNVNSRLSIYTIGLGSTVQDDVLNNLPLPAGAGPAGIYRNVTDVGLIKQAIAQMVGFSQEAQPIAPMPPLTTDRSPLGQQIYLRLEPKVNRLGLAIEWNNRTDTIELARRNQGDTAAFLSLDVGVERCPKHGFVTVDLAQLYGGEDSVPATEWRVVHRSGGIPQAISADNLLAFVDLFVKADIEFDRNEYYTGDVMTITCRIRAGSNPVTDAKVTVELARPGEGLGTFLATNGANYKPVQPSGADPAHPKLAMLQQLLRQNELNELPILKPPSIFADGSNQLFDDGNHEDGSANDGNYANIFKDTSKEGTYTFRFLVEGKLPDGSMFNRLFTISKWAGVKVDSLSSSVVLNFGLDASRGFRAAQIFVTPRDRSGEYLGPFRTSDVAFSTTAGQFQGDIISLPDGRYTQVIVYPQNEVPIVTVQVQGKEFLPTVVASGCLGWLFLWVRSLLEWLLRLIGR
ncbi:choice-of-anchor X domain-containing protein [Phormidesmis sp. 146-35]